MSEPICKCGAEKDEHYDGSQCPIGPDTYSATQTYEPAAPEGSKTAMIRYQDRWAVDDPVLDHVIFEHDKEVYRQMYQPEPEPDAGWCSSCDRIAEASRPKCPECGDWMIFGSDQTEIERLTRELARLNALVNTPETDDFFKGTELEAAHQRARWPAENDAGKTPADWFWLIGYLAGKCLHAHIAGNTEKALHHTISTAAALANWHRAIKGFGNMRPGIDTPQEADAQKEPL